MMWCRDCCADQSNYVLPKGERGVEGDWEGEVESWYDAGRNGDHMLTHFHCDVFHFRNIKGRSLEESILKDKTLLETIQR